MDCIECVLLVPVVDQPPFMCQHQQHIVARQHLAQFII